MHLIYFNFFLLKVFFNEKPLFCERFYTKNIYNSDLYKHSYVYSKRFFAHKRFIELETINIYTYVFQITDFLLYVK